MGLVANPDKIAKLYIIDMLSKDYFKTIHLKNFNIIILEFATITKTSEKKYEILDKNHKEI